MRPEGPRQRPARVLPKSPISFSTLFALALTLGLAAANPQRAAAGPDLALAREGVRLYKENLYDQAADKFTDASKLNPANGVVQYNLGTSLAKAKKFDAAAEALGKALNFEAAPPPGDAYYNLAYTQVMKAQGEGSNPAAKAEAAANPQGRLEQLEKGLNTFRQAVLANPKDADAKYNYETTSLLMKQLKEQMKQQEQQGGNQGKDDKKKGDKNDKKQENDSDKKDGDKGEPDDQQKKSDQQKQDEKKDQGEEQNQSDEERQKNEKDDKDPKQDEPGKDKSKEKDGKGEGKDKKQEEGMDKQPTPAGTPEGSPTPAAGTGETQPSDKQPTQEEIDAMRVLNSLSEDKPDQFKKLFQFKGARARVRPAKDW